MCKLGAGKEKRPETRHGKPFSGLAADWSAEHTRFHLERYKKFAVVERLCLVKLLILLFI